MKKGKNENETKKKMKIKKKNKKPKNLPVLLSYRLGRPSKDEQKKCKPKTINICMQNKVCLFCFICSSVFFFFFTLIRYPFHSKWEQFVCSSLLLLFFVWFPYFFLGLDFFLHFFLNFLRISSYLIVSSSLSLSLSRSLVLNYYKLISSSTSFYLCKFSSYFHWTTTTKKNESRNIVLLEAGKRWTLSAKTTTIGREKNEQTTTTDLSESIGIRVNWFCLKLKKKKEIKKEVAKRTEKDYVSKVTSNYCISNRF